jgi:hypothetical protein
MKTIKKTAAQGDVLFRRVDALPSEAKTSKTGASFVVAHSETGHHHVATVSRGGVAMLYDTPSPLVSFIRVGRGVHVDIVHQRPHDTHETVRLLGDEGAIWEIRRQREHTPEGWRRVQD